ncbi:ComEC/Rec2 family competence protein [Mangrovibacterium lignilyticum]|uniref:ComEC/Rec2 family competence protein n=1 Tax=Mangrovibacterium lignilyticum TaxID=2668052 RepID=UPI0013D6B9D3|nr:ComEC/Rec2 family competence protein [Mangrovibacterium lignilyticum]
MAFFSNNPFVKILGFWIAGLLLAKYCPLFLLAFVIWMIAGLIWHRKLYRNKRYPFDLVSSSLLVTVVLLLSAINYKIQHPLIPLPPIKETRFLATLMEKPAEKTNSYQLQLLINAEESNKLNGQSILCWAPKTEEISQMNTGDQLLCQAKINRIENRGNPFEFDYKSFLAQQGIYFSCYLNAQKIKPVAKSSFRLKLWAEQFREKLLNPLRTKLKRPENFQVISALCLGYRKELQPETRDYFSRTGAMHVLAVSGLHVGLIFLFLLRIFSFLNRRKKGKWLRFILIAAALWFYALLTGLSPSVQRATIMFTFLLLAETKNRTNSIYNSIAASAFALLLIHPDILFAVGFQLSYAAVLSIVYFYPLLEKVIPIKNKWLKKPWQLLCVSIAAQIGTFPLSIYYFHQFPVYFWLSNFVVIPAAFLILAGTFLFFASTPVSPVQEFLASLLDTLNSLVLLLLKRISELPGAVIANIPISGWQLLFLFGMILFTILFIIFRRARYLQYSLICLLFFQLLGITEKWNLLNQQRIISYNGQPKTYHFINGRDNYILCADTSKLSPFVYSNVVMKLQLKQPKTYLLESHLKIHERSFLFDRDICQFGNQAYLLTGLNKNLKSSSLIPISDRLPNLNELKPAYFHNQNASQH